MISKLPVLKISFMVLVALALMSCRPVRTYSPQSPCRILTIGDSNGATTAEQAKWPDTLAQCLGENYLVVNDSQGGRTIGFDNLGKESLNTLKQIHRILVDACAEMGEHSGFDRVLILLGTNDCKAEFDDRQSEVTANLELLIQAIQRFEYPDGHTPEITVISPPPYGQKAAATEKYRDADKRVKALIPKFKRLAKKQHCDFIDMHAPLQSRIEDLTIDGVHFTNEGYAVMGRLIAKALQ